jgi:hypothetical protein
VFPPALHLPADRPDVLRVARADQKRHPEDWATPESAERTLALVVEVLDEISILVAQGPRAIEASDVPRMHQLTRRSAPVRHNP